MWVWEEVQTNMSMKGLVNGTPGRLRPTPMPFPLMRAELPWINFASLLLTTRKRTHGAFQAASLVRACWPRLWAFPVPMLVLMLFGFVFFLVAYTMYPSFLEHTIWRLRNRFLSLLLAMSTSQRRILSLWPLGPVNFQILCRGLSLLVATAVIWQNANRSNSSRSVFPRWVWLLSLRNRVLIWWGLLPLCAGIELAYIAIAASSSVCHDLDVPQKLRKHQLQDLQCLSKFILKEVRTD